MDMKYGTVQDIESWMELVQQVRWNFPGLETELALEDHRKTVLRFMGENRALCVKNEKNVIGVLLFSKKRNMICCLAVAPEYRKNGIASALLKKALSELDRSKDITVTTFRANDEKGTAPRGLYKKFGFSEGELKIENDYPVQEFVLRGNYGKELSMLKKVESEILTLRKVLPADLDAIAEYRAEFLEKGGSMDGCSNLRRYDNMLEWYDWIQKAEHRETCAPNWVPDTQYISVRNSDGRIVGLLDIRHELNEACLNLFGNIGYSIRHSEREKGYATMQLALAKKVCESMGMEKILISCHKENIASAKTIIRNGGVLENEVVDERNGEVLQRYWIVL